MSGAAWAPGARGAQRRQKLPAVAGTGDTGADRKAPAIEPHLQRVAETDERVTREPLAPLDALEQKARSNAELHERRHRRAPDHPVYAVEE